MLITILFVVSFFTGLLGVLLAKSRLLLGASIGFVIGMILEVAVALKLTNSELVRYKIETVSWYTPLAFMVAALVMLVMSVVVERPPIIVNRRR